MNFGDQERSSIGPSANRNETIEIGTIRSVDRKNGTCVVITERGREVQVYIATQMAALGGTGPKTTPRIGSKCMVVLFVSGNTGMVRPEDGYLITTFQADEGDKEEWGAPGDFHISTESGGKLLITQSGVLDLQSDPWARQALLPQRLAIKQWCKIHERMHTPLAHDRTVHDDEAEVAFREFALNSRFLHRENDNRPDIYRALGNAQGSEEPTSFHPQAGALSFYRLEKRSEQGQNQERLTRLEGAQEREIMRETFEDLRDDNSLIRSIGVDGTTFHRKTLSHGDATRTEQFGKGIQTPGEVSREEVKYDGTSLLFRRGHFEENLTETLFTVDGEEVFSKEIFDDGRLLMENPEWTVEIEADGHLEATNGTTTINVEDDVLYVDNGASRFEINAQDIFVGDTADNKQEPLALGTTLQEFLEAFRKIFNTHTHTHPHGPTGPPITKFFKPSEPFKSKENWVD